MCLTVCVCACVAVCVHVSHPLLLLLRCRGAAACSPPRSPPLPDRAPPQGLARIHSEGMVHVDIKPENILVTDDWRFKIGDLGLIYLVGSDRTEIEGDNRYMAPELLDGPPTCAADIFSLGMVEYSSAVRARSACFCGSLSLVEVDCCTNLNRGLCCLCNFGLAAAARGLNACAPFVSE